MLTAARRTFARAPGRVYVASYRGQPCVVRRLDRAVSSLYSHEELKLETKALVELRHPHILRVLALVVEGTQVRASLADWLREAATRVGRKRLPSPPMPPPLLRR